jgi:ribosomal protein S12 methylthiotransferase accessory factor
VTAEPSAFHDFDEHVAHYLDPSRRAAFGFLLESPREPITADLDAPRSRVSTEWAARTVVARASAAGLACYAVDVTAPDVRTAGWWVVRSVLPGLYPLLVGTSARPPHPRLPADAPVNPDPHPFP